MKKVGEDPRWTGNLRTIRTMKNEALTICLTGLSDAQFVQQLYARNFLNDHLVEQLCCRLEDADATQELADLEEKVGALERDLEEKVGALEHDKGELAEEVEELKIDLGEMTEENRDLMKNNQRLMDENRALSNELHHLKLFGQG